MLKVLRMFAELTMGDNCGHGFTFDGNTPVEQYSSSKVREMKSIKKCEHCGREFASNNGMKKYCSVECVNAANAMRKKKQQDFYRAAEPIVDMRQQEYLTFAKAAVLMGCSRQYVYKLVGQGKLKASRLSSRMSFIRRADIDAMLDASPYNKVLFGDSPKKACKAKKCEVTAKHGTTDKVTCVEDDAVSNEDINYLSVEDIIKRYKVKPMWLYTTAKRNLVPMCRIAGKNYYSQRHVEDCLGWTAEIAAIEDWLTVEEVCRAYGIKRQMLRTYVYRHGIPTKRENGIIVYSKKHFDELMRPDIRHDPRYMTVEQIKDEYGVLPATMQRIAKRNGLKAERVGVRNFYLREEIEKVMAERDAKEL